MTKAPVRPFFLPLAFTLSALLTACGGEDSPKKASTCIDDETCVFSESTAVDTDSALTGRFVDAPVEGLAYTLYEPNGDIATGDVTVPSSGFTDENGEFPFYSGQLVEFSLGSIVIGRVTASELVSTRSFTGDSASYANNVARLLQSIDSTPLDSSVITIDSADVAQINDDESGQYDLSFDLDSDAFASQSSVQAVITNLTEGTLVSAEDAEAHVDASLIGLPATDAFQLELEGTVWKSVSFSEECDNEDIGMYGTFRYNENSWEWSGADYSENCSRDASIADVNDPAVPYSHEYSMCSSSTCSMAELNGSTEWVAEHEQFDKKLSFKHVKGSYVIDSVEFKRYTSNEQVVRDGVTKHYLVQDGETLFGINFKNTTWEVERFRPSECGEVSATFTMEFDDKGISRIVGDDLNDSCGTRPAFEGVFPFSTRPWSVGCFAEGIIGFCNFAELNSAYGYDGEVLDGKVEPYTHFSYEPKGATGDWGQIHWRESNKKAIWTRVE